MDPATIYAITVTLVGIGTVPEIKIERLPPQSTMADCIRDHEKKLANQPHTRAKCVSRDRFKPPPLRRYLISIDSDTRAVDLTKWKGTLSECREVVSRYSDRVRAFCVEAAKLDKCCRTRSG